MLRNSRVVCHLLVSFLFAMMFLAGSAQALEAEHEMRRLMLATEAAVEKEQWVEASGYLNRLQKMEQQKPTDYLYYRGRVMLEAGQLNEAQSALEGYVASAGADGQHYTEALTLLTRVEKARNEERSAAGKAAAQKSEPVAIIKPAEETTLDQLRKLYLVNSDSEALVIHLNTLLDDAAWRKEQRVIRLDQPADITYKVNRKNDSLSIQQARRESDDRIVRTAQSISVFGINPQIEWGCEPAASACWVYDPRDGSRLLQLNNSRSDAREIARTLGRLIRHMQSPD